MKILVFVFRTSIDGLAVVGTWARCEFCLFNEDITNTLQLLKPLFLDLANASLPEFRVEPSASFRICIDLISVSAWPWCLTLRYETILLVLTDKCERPSPFSTIDRILCWTRCLHSTKIVTH